MTPGTQHTGGPTPLREAGVCEVGLQLYGEWLFPDSCYFSTWTFKGWLPPVLPHTVQKEEHPFLPFSSQTVGRMPVLVQAGFLVAGVSVGRMCQR
jgi:hypothetical protein